MDNEGKDQCRTYIGAEVEGWEAFRVARGAAAEVEERREAPEWPGAATEVEESREASRVVRGAAADDGRGGEVEEWRITNSFVVKLSMAIRTLRTSTTSLT